MKLSVIVPVYNSQNYLDKCLNSIVNQTYKDLEIIIINDGSTDDSEKIINNYIAKYPKLIKYFKQENKGQAEARNIALKLAIGEYITFVDSDDYIDKTMYQKMMDLALKENTDIVICDFWLLKNNTKEIIKATNFSNLIFSSVCLWNKIFKKSILEDINFIKGIWYEDYNFFIKLCLKKPTYSMCSEPLYYYIVHDNSTMNNEKSLKNLDIIKATEDILKENIKEEDAQTLIVNHILIDAINRVQKQKSKDKKMVIKKLNAFVHKHIKNITKAKVYKNSSFKRKIIILLNYYNLSKISYLLLKVKGS